MTHKATYQYRPSRKVRFLMWMGFKGRSTGCLVLAMMLATIEEGQQRIDHTLWGPHAR